MKCNICKNEMLYEHNRFICITPGHLTGFQNDLIWFDITINNYTISFRSVDLLKRVYIRHNSKYLVYADTTIHYLFETIKLDTIYEDVERGLNKFLALKEFL
jgi:hypothetical protein